MESVFAKPKYLKAAYPHQFSASLCVSQLAGGRPRDPKIAEGWLSTKLADKDDLIRQGVAEVMLDQGVNVEEATQIVDELKHLVGFSRDEHGLYVYGYQIKAMLKEAASIARSVGKLPTTWGLTKKGILGFVTEHIFVVEDHIPLGVTEPSDVVQSFPENKRVGMRGIQYTEYVTDAKLSFTVIADHDFKDEEWAVLWMTAEQQGLGAMRSQGFGRFVVTGWEATSP